jgi:K+-sensing histidine kinase KdpD
VALHGVLSQAIEAGTEFAGSREVAIGGPFLGSPYLVVGNERLLVKAFHTLLVTAIKFSDPGRTVLFSAEALPDSIRVDIEGPGRAIPDSELPKFFDLFSISEASTPAGDLGLGPAVASRILALFGASVTAANLDAPGVRLSVSLPRAASASALLDPASGGMGVECAPGARAS